MDKLSVIIPARNEEGCIESTVISLYEKLVSEGIPHELVIVNDGSTDRTREIVGTLSTKISSITLVNNTGPNGFGYAVRCGLESFSGDVVGLFMADASDSPEDLVRFYKKLQEGYDCVFGDRWGKGGKTYDYPFVKKFINRVANKFIRLLLQTGYDDVTNAFKLYRKQVIDGIQPILSCHYNLTVELPLKAIVRGYSYAVISNSWTNRKAGVSKLKIKEMGSRYLFVVLYCLIEKWLSRKDYHKSNKIGALQKLR